MPIPKVILAGAGPGDIDLVTIKLVNALKSADYILVDRLVNQEIVNRYANQNAEIINVGKQGYTKNSMDQININKLIVDHALAGHQVLRLKGGDVGIFSNVLEEINALQENNITYEIIPGITAVSGIAASLGIPLTGRDYASGVEIISLATHLIISELDYSHWANSKNTLVFYMSLAPLKNLVQKLLQFGADKNKPVVIIEQGTTPFQRVTKTYLEQIDIVLEKQVFVSPTLIIIGDIVNRIQNLPPGININDSFFNSLDPKTKNIKIHAA